LRIDAPTRERLEQAWRDHPLRLGSRTLTAFAADVLGRGIGMEEARLAAGQVSPPAVSESNIRPAPEPPAPVGCVPILQQVSHGWRLRPAL